MKILSILFLLVCILLEFASAAKLRRANGEMCLTFQSSMVCKAKGCDWYVFYCTGGINGMAPY